MIKIEVHSTRAVIRSQEVLTVGLRGAKVHFSFDQSWKNLIKTAVFRQGDTVRAMADIGTQVTVPWEVLTQPGVPVEIGVYGTGSAGGVAIPTVWAKTEPVRPGADPEADPSAEPTPGLWEQMQAKLGDLTQLETEEKSSLVEAINEVNRPVFVVTVSRNEDGIYTADKNPLELVTAYRDGKMLMCYMDGLLLCLTYGGNNATIFEFEAFEHDSKYRVTINMAGKVERSITTYATMQSKLPNPKKLTFTGAVETEYDGSQEVTVKIPDGAMVVTVTPEYPSPDGVYQIDCDPEDILAAINRDVPVICSMRADHESHKLYLTKYYPESYYTFTGVSSGTEHSVSIYQDGRIYCKAQKLDERFIVTARKNEDGTCTMDKTCQELTEAYRAGKTLRCLLELSSCDLMLPLTEYQPGGPYFFSAVSDTVEYRVAIRSDNTVSCSVQELDKPVHVVTVTPEYSSPDGLYQIDCDPEDILESINNDVTVICNWRIGHETLRLYLSDFYPNTWYVFTGISDWVAYTVFIHHDGRISCSAYELARTVDIPTKTSQLENDAGFLKHKSTVYNQVYQQPDGSYTADLYAEELWISYKGENAVFCKYGELVLPLTYASETLCVFSCVHEGSVHTMVFNDEVGAVAVSYITTPLSSFDTGTDAPKEAVLYIPQDLTPEQKAQARQNIGSTEKLEIEVSINEDGYAELVGPGVYSVFDAVNAGTSVVLYRNTEEGRCIYYSLDERSSDSDGGESLVFTHISSTLHQSIILIKGGPFDGGGGSVGVGTEIITADEVGAVPVPMTAQIGQTMCVKTVDESGKPTEWEATGVPTPYTLPIATPDALGGVKPATKTEDMTQSVGVDESGGLWTVPGGGDSEGNASPLELLVEYTVSEEEATSVKFVFTDDVYPGIANCKSIVFAMIHPEVNSGFNKYFHFKCGDTVVFTSSQSGGYGCFISAEVSRDRWLYGGVENVNNSSASQTAIPGYKGKFTMAAVLQNVTYKDYDNIDIYSYGQFLLPGTKFMIWGAK